MKFYPLFLLRNRNRFFFETQNFPQYFTISSGLQNYKTRYLSTSSVISFTISTAVSCSTNFSTNQDQHQLASKSQNHHNLLDSIFLSTFTSPNSQKNSIFLFEISLKGQIKTDISSSLFYGSRNLIFS